ncbi:hypothetical protein H0I29_02790 [Polaribacter sp. R2A056_3_33]|jgi:hypothetical protein|uniref:hypothetical protein n=1 Tax=Polaribacter sp. R2A056_3_33 TaxID=2745563 RepID=UPI001C4FD976|nr:hypothetical protein [Polaribacter sp. R2A056_3_33]QXP71039.1 hypothetical protein H0I29_02790 [Polaribacter sp. R2A056_3_33]
MYILYKLLTPKYLLRKYKKGKKRLPKTDIEKLNLKGNVKKYQIIKNERIILELVFNKYGYLISKFENSDTKIYKYKLEEKKLYCIKTYFGVEISHENLISKELFNFNKGSNKPISKKTKNYKFSTSNIEDKYNYDIRGNLISIVTFRGSNFQRRFHKLTMKYFNLENNKIEEKIYFSGKERHLTKYLQIGEISIKTINKYLVNLFSNNRLCEVKALMDKNRNVISEEIYTLITGTLKTTTSYEFDITGNWIQKKEETSIRVKNGDGTNKNLEEAIIEYW